MKKIINLIISLATIFLLIFLLIYYILFPDTFRTVFIIGIIFITILILYNFLISFGLSGSKDTETVQDFFMTAKENSPVILETKKKNKIDSFEIILNQILYPLQMIESAMNILNSNCEQETRRFALLLIQKNTEQIKKIIGEKVYNLDDDTAENEIPYDFETTYINQEKEHELSENYSIGIFGEPTSERLTLRLILQSYGFFTRIISSPQETVSLIEDKMINLLIILPENEKENDENLQICTKIREKFTLLDFPILLIVNKYRSYIIKRNHDLQINDFLIRPFDVSALLTRIKMLYDYQNLYLQNQELLKSEKEKRTFLYFVTHNVNTPLTILLNEIENIAQQKDNINEQTNDVLLIKRTNLKNIQECSNQINIIIQNVLNSYKISDGKVLVSPKIINLLDFCKNENKFLTSKAEFKNQKFTFECNLKNPRVFCDENSLKGIYINLVDNAIKYTDMNGNICVKIFGDDENTFLSVCDNGQGISKEKQRVLFNRFADIGSKTTRKEKSVGLGLFVINELCILNNIDVEYKENENAEHGSIFTLKFLKIG